ncbi:retrovirus-related Pol polyprotein from transposon 17.6 [Trichonephila clavata]|uniref:Retrovirus-related Pol polyprotein from transposon 17.6 n=1 Tax=Trichonephila clavata TaxID=2740835 RepID=A0A8X6LT21_TRICU|nr:retrovirus-related Pol polyprotein from transposon 17.6 [Trichonephila clavata]
MTKCKICQKSQKENQKEILINPRDSGQTIAKSCMGFLLLKTQTSANDLSKDIELKLLNSAAAKSVITVMKSIYTTHGIPEDLLNDGGPPFNSNLMMNFFQEWGIIYYVTPPHFPRDNGLIERAVQTVINYLTKAEEEGKDLHVLLHD